MRIDEIFLNMSLFQQSFGSKKKISILFYIKIVINLIKGYSKMSKKVHVDNLNFNIFIS